MPLQQRASKKSRSFDLPVSYRIGEARDRLRDALNVFSNQGRLETRYGRSVYNPVSLGASVNSISFFKHANGSRYLIAKVGTSLISVSNSGAHTTIKTGLSSTTKHRGITWARGVTSRHIISIETDGLFQFDGTNFTQLGADGPTAPTVNVATGTMTGNFIVYLTYYSSTTGFETNKGAPATLITLATQGIGLTAIPTTCPNATIDKIRVYLKDTASADDPVYVTELSLGTTSYIIADRPVSTESYPLANAKPLSGGGKFMTEFNRKLVYAGNGTYKNDVFFSEQDIPEAFNDGTAPSRLVLNPIYDGFITGIATGLYNNTVLDPYLVIFKERSIHVYSEINGEGKLVPISAQLGCVSNETISTKNGNIYFLSTNGWRVIENGRIVVGGNGNGDKANPATLGLGDIDDIFTSPGYIYQVNRSRLSDAFSVYYATLDQYMTWISEGANATLSKTYVYEYKIGGFKPYEFNTPSTCACTGEDATGAEVVYMADANGKIYTHSTAEERTDADALGVAQPIYAFALMAWMDGDDMDASYNFRELILRRTVGMGDLSVRAWVNYNIDEVGTLYTYANALTGFVLDVSKLDIDKFGTDERTIITARSDINLCGENIMIGFYQNELYKNIGLVTSQLDYSRNGNRNV